ncbi:DUF5995 family protein [Phaeacidiphilus oryzae]|uniref:DUF5995 family protein n=1 Tax=Phaeacidiphilus oryzae TaxID=348818 RepID=UPI00055DC9E8|nr:DUF5995 family protein [Phaeacidiphilus oryzae]
MATVTAPLAPAIGALRTLAATPPPGDGVAVFARMYLVVTQAVDRHLRLTRYFQDPEATGVLAVLFADRFLDALDARPAPACWRPLLALRRHPGIRPIQFALAGMNAHIEHDLPLALLDTCARTGRALHDMSADFHRVNDVLAEVEEKAREELAPAGHGDDPDEPLLHLLGCWSIDRARDAAWASAHALWELRSRPEAYAATADALSDSVGLISRCLLTPLR